MENKKKGGTRLGAGAKKKAVGDKKIQISSYFKKKDIERLGGKDIVNQFITIEIENKVRNIENN